MAYYTTKQLKKFGFKSIGKNIKISEKASIYNCDQIEIDDFSRIDDFCVISGNLKIGRNVHITPHCVVAGGLPGIVIESFSTLAYNCKVFSQTDDYSGKTMTNSTIPKKYKKETLKKVLIKKHSIIGTGSIVMPGVTLGVGTSIGANSLVLRSTNSWEIHAGSPAKKISNRKKDLVLLEKQFLDNN